MSDEIKPALTAEEWDEFLNSGRRSPTAEDEFEQNREAAGHTAEEMRRVYLKDAARSLHQAGRHGFTWDDVDEMRDSAHYLNHGTESRQEGAGAYLYRISDKIAALLPPRGAE
jgi:hypothetical protein